jgi:predicted tellurium resistance membrane protein TerC
MMRSGQATAEPHQGIPKGYICLAVGFSVFVEILNMRLRQVSREPVKLREPYVK